MKYLVSDNVILDPHAIASQVRKWYDPEDVAVFIRLCIGSPEVAKVVIDLLNEEFNGDHQNDQ